MYYQADGFLETKARIPLLHLAYSLHLINEITESGGWLFTQTGVNFNLRILRGNQLRLNISSAPLDFFNEMLSMTPCDEIKDAVISIVIGFLYRCL